MTSSQGTRPPSRLLLRMATAAAACVLLGGSVVVSCSGDPPGATGGNPSSQPPSRAFGQWSPPAASTERFCSKALHDSYLVIGPDGRKYPTWHPPTATEDGLSCTFGHDHGADPGGYADWGDLRRHFAFDANSNGVIDDSELANAGIPFGYVSEVASGAGALLTEPHESYKIVWANALPRTRTVNNQQVNDVTCDLLQAFNQDVAGTSALTNHRFSMIHAADCASIGAVLPAYRARVILSALVPYGNANEIVDVTAPTDAPGRQIPTLARAQTRILVVAGNSSDYANGLTERWNGTLRLVRSDLTELATATLGVGAADPFRVVASATQLTASNSIDLCYAALDANGVVAARQARGGACAAMPGGAGPNVAPKIAADAPQAAFRGCLRYGYPGGLVVRNLAGPNLWYTDADGTGARTTSFTGGLKQLVDLSDTGSQPLTGVRIDGPPCAASVRRPN